MKNLSTINWTTLLPAAKASLFKLSWFTIAFGFIKLNAFVAALFLSNFVSNIADYGLFEYALSIGFMIAIPLDFGLNGAYPYFNLKLKKGGYQSLFYFHAFMIGLLAGSLFFVNQFIIQIIPEKYFFALLIGGIVAMQVLSSSILKSHEVLLKAILFDGGLFLTLNAYNLWLYSTENPFDVQILQLSFGVYLLFLTLWHGYSFWKRRIDFSFKRYKEALNFGRHLVFSAVLIILLTGSARVFIEHFLDLEAVGYYGFYFRFAAITVLLHQIVNIVFFKKMYQSDANNLDQYFSWFLGLLIIAGLILWQLIPPLFSDYLVLLKDSYSTYKSLYLVLTFQMVFWVALALNENIIYREGLSNPMNYGFLIIVLLMIGSFWGFYQLELLDLFWLTVINTFAIFLAAEYQFYLLKQKNIRFPKMQITERSILFLFFICIALYS